MTLSLYNNYYIYYTNRHHKGVNKCCHSSHLNVMSHQSPSNDGGSVSGKGELCGKK